MGKKQTAITQMINYLVSLSNSGHPLNTDYQDSILNKAYQLLDIERKQIADAFHEGTKSDLLLSTIIDLPEEYYNKTFGE